MKGVLFKPEMIKAIAEGCKTVTRRTDGLKEINIYPDERLEYKGLLPNDYYLKKSHHSSFKKHPEHYHWFLGKQLGEINPIPVKPRYHAGETVYVKETWRVGAWNQDNRAVAIDYKLDNFARKEWLQVPDNFDFEKLWIQSTDDAEVADSKYDESGAYYWEPGESPCRWRSPLFMPEWASRHFLMIDSVRPERFILANMTPDEIKLEGGEQAVILLKEYGGLWLWRIEFHPVKQEVKP